MPEPLKNVYNESFFESFLQTLTKVYSPLDKRQFLTDIYTDDWPEKELKQRMYHISATLFNHLPKDFEVATAILVKVSQLLKTKEESTSFEHMFLPDYIEKYGLNHYDTSIKAMEEITKFTSCEFAVRPFIIKYQDKMLSQLLSWSQHEHLMVRRLASEGSRPRLPWAIALPEFKKDPLSIIPILENLKNDPSEMVRRSVANNLNDISKDNPSIVTSLVKKWKGKSIETDKLVKHASRTLLKEGNNKIMQLFGFGDIQDIEISNFQILTPKVKIGKSLEFSFELRNRSKKVSKIRLEYGIYYQKANKSLSRKVFKISEKEYLTNSISKINRKQPFRVITTRKLYYGHHQVSLIINGKEVDKLDFTLQKP
ncbi:DNA alkylation repair protein [Aquimarina gracilis]|uniref:DNA alkylation repair protein n=1 Tax=Aquimarina gracilis TaxID=874422 RepID=A0ABU5ZXH4_9FLAO|nr:DNA alkylation repair protein [Aquimarina gracilis]MEB3346584.1 DNA alkylation repair protein [Aquimarina gracilis]